MDEAVDQCNAHKKITDNLVQIISFLLKHTKDMPVENIYCEIFSSKFYKIVEMVFFYGALKDAKHDNLLYKTAIMNDNMTMLKTVKKSIV